ncbi:MAG: biopolymer transporter ExbD [Colwellia sp.]|nr:biopolymer transporter ExbD [Colwellia sp.]MCW8866384.1 biopolymer transporter ExbD [Colwellia sp.]MCW9080898.1 biopolymer transporter ExbD [Colwellia sp.]
MARKRTKKEPENLEPDMTPMLDIVFILLIFFIVTTSFVKEEGLVVNRPKMNKSSSDNTPTMLVKISENGRVTLNGKGVDIERLPARIENFIAKNNSNSVVVIPKYKTRHEDVVRVLDQIKTFEQLTVSIGK